MVGGATRNGPDGIRCTTGTTGPAPRMLTGEGPYLCGIVPVRKGRNLPGLQRYWVERVQAWAAVWTASQGLPSGGV